MPRRTYGKTRRRPQGGGDSEVLKRLQEYYAARARANRMSSSSIPPTNRRNA